MNEEKLLKDSYGSMELPETDMYKAVMGRLNAPKQHRKVGIKPTVLIVAIMIFTIGCTATAVTAINVFPDFIPNEFSSAAAFRYAANTYRQKEDNQLFYTREQIKEWWDNGETEHQANKRQPHFMPAFSYGGVDYYVEGIKNPALCNNTIYYIYLERRVCGSCGYVFSLEQDKEIGLDW